MDRTFNFLDWPMAPLKRYLPGAQAEDGRLRLSTGDVFGDWGLDDGDVSSPTLVNGHSSVRYTPSEADLSAETPLVEQHVFGDWGVSPTKESQRHTQGNRTSSKTYVRHNGARETFQLLIRKQEIMGEECSAFLDEFKYVLVTSQLLDETILVSRFYNKKKSSNLSLRSSEKRGVLTSMGRIRKLHSRYTISSIVSHYNTVRVASILVYLKKHHTSHTAKQLRPVMAILLLTLWLHIRSKASRFFLIQTTLLNKLRQFIKQNQKLDTLTQKLLNKYKELKLYPSLIPSSPQIPDFSCVALYDCINSSIFIVSQALVSGLKQILPLVSSTELENYCGIYNIDLPELAYLLHDSGSELTDYSPNALTMKVKRLQFIRRLFICTLLAFSMERSNPSTFTSDMCAVFEVTMYPSSLVFENWRTISETLETLHTVIHVAVESMKNFATLNNLSLGVLPIQSNPQGSVSSRNPDPTIGIMRKLKELQLDILTFNRDQTADDLLANFKEIGAVIESLQLVYQNEIDTLESSTNQRQFHLSKQRSLSNSKRFISDSSPHMQLTSPHSTSFSATSPVNHKRLSSGLMLPLLTVLEDASPLNATSTPPGDYIEENHLLSNDDTVVISSNADDTFDGMMTSEELRKKLESKFERFVSTSTTVQDLIERQGEEISKNDIKVCEVDSVPLMSELKTALQKRS